MVTLLAFFALGAWGFWLALVLASILIITCIENDSGPKATLTFVGTCVLLAWANKFGWSDFLAHWQTFAFSAVVYFAAGAVWGMVKWFSYVHQIRRKFDAILPKILKDFHVNSLAELSDNSKYKAVEELKRQVYGYYSGAPDLPPQFSQNKSNVLFWMTFWPWSLFWTLLDDPIRRIFETIYRKFGKIGQRISDAAFADVAQDLK
jgi:hypothetical protein